MNRVIADRPAADEKAPRTSLWLAVSVSLILHGLVATLFFSLGLGAGDTRMPPTPTLVTINFVPPPTSPSAPPDPVTESAAPQLVEQTAADEVNQSDTATAELQNSLVPSPDVALPRPLPSLVDVPIVMESTVSEPPAQEPVRTPLRAPTLMAIRQSIKSISRENEADDWKYVCNTLQQQNPLLECQSQSQYDFSILDQSATYRRFNPLVLLNTGRQTQALLGRNAGEISARLASLMAAQGVSNEYIAEEVEAGISVYSSNANAPVQRLQNQIYANDPAYQQKKRVLGDP